MTSDDASAVFLNECLPRLVRLPDAADMRIGIGSRPPELRLPIECYKARHPVIRRAMDEHFPAAGGVHDIEELIQVAGLRRFEVDRDVVVLDIQRFDQTCFVREAVAWIKQAEVHDDLEACR